MGKRTRQRLLALAGGSVMVVGLAIGGAGVASADDGNPSADWQKSMREGYQTGWSTLTAKEKTDFCGDLGSLGYTKGSQVADLVIAIYGSQQAALDALGLTADDLAEITAAGATTYEFLSYTGQLMLDFCPA